MNKTGYQIIEDALKLSANRDWLNSPISMSPSEGLAYQDGLSAAYCHALEMFPNIEEKFQRYEKILKNLHNTLENDGHGLWLPEIGVKEFNGGDESISYEDFLNQLENDV